jgi:hypothetical protein
MKVKGIPEMRVARGEQLKGWWKNRCVRAMMAAGRKLTYFPAIEERHEPAAVAAGAD